MGTTNKRGVIKKFKVQRVTPTKCHFFFFFFFFFKVWAFAILSVGRPKGLVSSESLPMSPLRLISDFPVSLVSFGNVQLKGNKILQISWGISPKLFPFLPLLLPVLKDQVKKEKRKLFERGKPLSSHQYHPKRRLHEQVFLTVVVCHLRTRSNK